MKKVKYLLLLVLFALITTGCVKFNATMDIKKDKSMEFSVIYAFDKSLMGEDNALKEEDMSEPKKCGFEVSKYSEGNYEGFKLVRKITNIDEVSAEEDVTYDLSGMMDQGVCGGKIFKVVKGEDKNTYVAKLKFDSNSNGMTENTDDEEIPENDVETTVETTDETTPDDEIMAGDEDNFDLTSEGSNMDLSGLMNNLDLSFSVNLPYGALSSNATTKENDNKKLTWKLGTEAQTIEFTFELKNNDSDSNMMLYIAVGAAVLVFILLLILVISKTRKNKAVPQEVNNYEPVTEPVVEPPVENVVPETNVAEGPKEDQQV